MSSRASLRTTRGTPESAPHRWWSPKIAARSPTSLHEPGQIGLARAWVDGSLTACGDLEDVLATRNVFDEVHLSLRDRLLLALAAARAAGLAVLRRPPVPSIEAVSTGRRHSLVRDRTSVRHHYDISNDFYRLVLGPSMTYSCACRARAWRPRSSESTPPPLCSAGLRKPPRTKLLRGLDLACSAARARASS